MSIFSEFTKTRTGTVQLTYDMIRRMAKMRFEDGTNPRDFTQRMVSLTDKAMGFGGVLEISPGEYLVTRLFQEFIVNQKEKRVIATLNPRFKNYFVDNKKNFTLIILPQFVGLKTKYGKNLYRNLCQFAGNRQSGYWKVSYNEYKERMAFPASQVPGQVWRSTQKAISEVIDSGEFLRIDATKEYNDSKQGRPLETICFRFERNLESLKKKLTGSSSTILNQRSKVGIVCPHCLKEMVPKRNKTTGEMFLGHKDYKNSDCNQTYPSIEELEKDRENMKKLNAQKEKNAEQARKAWDRVVEEHDALLSEGKHSPKV